MLRLDRCVDMHVRTQLYEPSLSPLEAHSRCLTTECEKENTLLTVTQTSVCVKMKAPMHLAK